MYNKIVGIVILNSILVKTASIIDDKHTDNLKIINDHSLVEVEHSGDYSDELIKSYSKTKSKHIGIEKVIDDGIGVDWGNEELITITNSSLKIKGGNMQTDIQEFIDLIPAEEIKAKINEYYTNDKDVQHIYDYINGKEFKQMKKNVCELQEVKSLFNYLQRNGLNIKDILHKLDELLGLSKLKSPLYRNKASNTTIGGLYGLIEEILCSLPQDEIFILFFDKMDSSVEFANAIESIGSEDFGRRFDSLKKSTNLQMVLGTLRKHNIDVGKIIELFQSYFFFGTF